MTNAILELQKNSYLRLPQIIGNPKADPPISPVYPVSKSTWWAACQRHLQGKRNIQNHQNPLATALSANIGETLSENNLL